MILIYPTRSKVDYVYSEDKYYERYILGFCNRLIKFKKKQKKGQENNSKYQVQME